MRELSIGFPRMHKESGEVRDFLPSLIRQISPMAQKVVLEEGIGSGMGIPQDRYVENQNNVRLGDNLECYGQDIVVQVRSTENDELLRMKPATILFSMLHYSTHPGRVKLLEELELCAVSMDSVVDDFGNRLIENLRGTSWNAIEAGFRALEKTYHAFGSPDRQPLEVVVVGTGPVGRYAAEAATKYGDVELHEKFMTQRIPGVIVHLVGRSLTQDEAAFRDLLAQADMFVDATFRPDPTQILFSNELVGDLPEHAVVVDVTADPYITKGDSVQVKALEGIPTGNLDEYEFPPNHPAFDRIPPAVSTKHRRMTVSCYSWPALKAKECMDLYGRQTAPLIEVLLRKPLGLLSEDSTDCLERALYGMCQAF